MVEKRLRDVTEKRGGKSCIPGSCEGMVMSSLYVPQGPITPQFFFVAFDPGASRAFAEKFIYYFTILPFLPADQMLLPRFSARWVFRSQSPPGLFLTY